MVFERPRRAAGVLLGAALLVLASACGSASGGGGGGGKPIVVAAENFWGSIASQVGGSQIRVESIITNPDADPHSYTTNSNDGKAVAQAALVVYNGAGYDPWMDGLLKSNPSSSRSNLNVAKLVGKQDGDNPHFWYSPDYVHRVIERIASLLKKVNGVDGSAIDNQKASFESQGLGKYNSLIASIKQKYAGTPVGATESIFVYLSDALGLKLLTPYNYMKAISEGDPPSAADKVTVDQQVTQKQIKVFVFNSQNSTSDVSTEVNKAKAEQIPIVEITETLTPANLSFEAWQVKQLQGLQQALASVS